MFSQKAKSVTDLIGKQTVTCMLLLTFFQIGPLFGQGFIESYSFREVTGDVADHVITVDSNIFIHIVSVVDTPFTHGEGGMAKINWNGDVIWNNIWSFGFGFVGTSFANGVVATEDTVYTTGNYSDWETGVFSPAIVANSVTTGEYRAIRFPYDHRASIHDLFYNEDSTFTAISEDWVSDDFYFPIIVEQLDKAGRSNSSLEYRTNFARSSATNSARSRSGSIYVAHIGCLGPNSDCYPFQGWLSKINADGSFAWNRSYGFTANRQPVRPDVAVLNDTTIAYAWTRDTNDFNIQESPPIIYYLDTLGNERDSFAFHGNLRTVQKLIPCANGDVVGVGYARVPGLRFTGWMFRLDAEANLVWERYVQDHRQTTGTETDLETVTEAADGSIIAAGDIFHGFPPRDGGERLRAWVVKLDADGCLEPGCTSDTIYLEFPTAIAEPLPTSETALQVWPNPAEDYLQWSVPDLPVFRQLTGYRITNVNGYSVRSGRLLPGEQRIDVQGLPAGVYFLNLLKDGKNRGVRKFVKR
jgi:hypothetical protein